MDCLEIRKKYYECCRKGDPIKCRAELDNLFDCLYTNIYVSRKVI